MGSELESVPEDINFRMTDAADISDTIHNERKNSFTGFLTPESLDSDNVVIVTIDTTTIMVKCVGQMSKMLLFVKTGKNVPVSLPDAELFQ